MSIHSEKETKDLRFNILGFFHCKFKFFSTELIILRVFYYGVIRSGSFGKQVDSFTVMPSNLEITLSIPIANPPWGT